MKETDILITPIPQANGELKNRPVLILKIMPKYNDYLVCGISSQLKQYIENFDEIISPDDEDFSSSFLLG
jgi:mRNA interferase MazF